MSKLLLFWSFFLSFQIGFQDDHGSISTYEDRTSRFFPPAPRVPQMPGLVSGDTSFIDDSEDSFQELSNSSQQHFNILCSGDRDGTICFSIFGIFPIGKIVSVMRIHGSLITINFCFLSWFMYLFIQLLFSVSLCSNGFVIHYRISAFPSSLCLISHFTASVIIWICLHLWMCQNIHKCCITPPSSEEQTECQLLNASISKVYPSFLSIFFKFKECIWHYDGHDYWISILEG